LFLSAALRSEAPVTTLLTSQLVSQPAAALGAASHFAYGAASTATASDPNPANYSSYEAYRADVSGPYSEDYMMQQWANTHGWQSGQ
jgi:hypothetical protein